MTDSWFKKWLKLFPKAKPGHIPGPGVWVTGYGTDDKGREYVEIAIADGPPPLPKPVEKEIVQKHEEIGRMLGEVARGLANILEHEHERGAHSALKRLEESIERAIQKVERGHRHGIALPAPRTTTMHGFSMGHGGHIPGGVFKHFDTQVHEILNSIASEFENKIMGLVTNWNKHPGLDIGDMVVFLRKANELKKQYLNNVPPALRGQLEKLLNEKINKVVNLAMSVLI